MRAALRTRLSSAAMLKISCVLILLASSAPCIVNALTAHLVPHTHDDAGWLKTVDEYYLGLDPLSSCEPHHFASFLILSTCPFFVLNKPHTQPSPGTGMVTASKFAKSLPVLSMLCQKIPRASLCTLNKFSFKCGGTSSQKTQGTWFASWLKVTAPLFKFSVAVCNCCSSLHCSRWSAPFCKRWMGNA